MGVPRSSRGYNDVRTFDATQRRGVTTQYAGASSYASAKVPLKNRVKAPASASTSAIASPAAATTPADEFDLLQIRGHSVNLPQEVSVQKESMRKGKNKKAGQVVRPHSACAASVRVAARTRSRDGSATAGSKRGARRRSEETLPSGAGSGAAVSREEGSNYAAAPLSSSGEPEADFDKPQTQRPRPKSAHPRIAGKTSVEGSDYRSGEAPADVLVQAQESSGPSSRGATINKYKKRPVSSGANAHVEGTPCLFYGAESSSPLQTGKGELSSPSAVANNEAPSRAADDFICGAVLRAVYDDSKDEIMGYRRSANGTLYVPLRAARPQSAGPTCSYRIGSSGGARRGAAARPQSASSACSGSTSSVVLPKNLRDRLNLQAGEKENGEPMVRFSEEQHTLSEEDDIDTASQLAAGQHQLRRQSRAMQGRLQVGTADLRNGYDTDLYSYDTRLPQEISRQLDETMGPPIRSSPTNKARARSGTNIDEQEVALGQGDANAAHHLQQQMVETERNVTRHLPGLFLDMEPAPREGEPPFDPLRYPFSPFAGATQQRGTSHHNAGESDAGSSQMETSFRKQANATYWQAVRVPKQGRQRELRAIRLRRRWRDDEMHEHIAAERERIAEEREQTRMRRGPPQAPPRWGTKTEEDIWREEVGFSDTASYKSNGPIRYSAEEPPLFDKYRYYSNRVMRNIAIERPPQDGLRTLDKNFTLREYLQKAQEEQAGSSAQQEQQEAVDHEPQTQPTPPALSAREAARVILKTKPGDVNRETDYRRNMRFFFDTRSSYSDVDLQPPNVRRPNQIMATIKEQRNHEKEGVQEQEHRPLGDSFLKASNPQCYAHLEQDPLPSLAPRIFPQKHVPYTALFKRRVQVKRPPYG
ncbi:unnamed protein product [Amoebophrya sp. A25]|nr:unnamed protein product [Amoebophrya sp. A25]|eukprot:GSA25T00013868001.1